NGAHLARYTHDFRLVRRLIEAVPDTQLDAVAALLLGEALYELGDFEASDRVLASGQELVSSEHVALRLAVTRAKNAHWGLCQPEAALAINAQARRVIGDQPLVEELVADEASILMFSGHPDRAIEVLSRIAGNDRRTRVVRAIVEAVAPGRERQDRRRRGGRRGRIRRPYDARRRTGDRSPGDPPDQPGFRPDRGWPADRG
ncbi:MAG TPA: hypothetical protein VF940_23230, partial [Streptosporangiaceae bacterium]